MISNFIYGLLVAFIVSLVVSFEITPDMQGQYTQKRYTVGVARSIVYVKESFTGIFEEVKNIESADKNSLTPGS